MDLKEQLKHDHYSHLGFLLFPNGTVKEYGVSFDQKKNNPSYLLSHLESALKVLKEEGYDIETIPERNIYLLAQKLCFNKIITYVNLSGTSINKEGMLHIGTSLTKEEKEKLYELRFFLENIKDMVVNLSGTPIEVNDFYKRLEDATEVDKYLYLKRY